MKLASSHQLWSSEAARNLLDRLNSIKPIENEVNDRIPPAVDELKLSDSDVVSDINERDSFQRGIPYFVSGRGRGTRLASILAQNNKAHNKEIENNKSRSENGEHSESESIRISKKRLNIKETRNENENVKKSLNKKSFR